MLATITTTLLLAACHTTGTPPFTVPDNQCTPGAYVQKTRRDICDGRTDRPRLPLLERRAITMNYGVPAWSGSDGELDHRVPLVFGGTTDRRNVWPEREVNGRNPKDLLELRLYRRVCFRDPRPMRPLTAIRVFLSNWIAGYDYYVLGHGAPPF
jgi:hypothetical protein